MWSPRRRAAAVAAVVLAVATVLPACSLFDKRVDVLYIGDSIMAESGQFVDAYLTERPEVGSAKTRVEAVNGTGLLTPGLLDWQAKARALIDTYQPKVVVVLFIGNYTDGSATPLWTAPDGTTVANDYGDGFFTEWRRQAEALRATLTSRGAQVDWVLPPPLVGPEGERRVTGMRRTYEALAAAHPPDATIDAAAALGGPSGEWVWRRPGVDGGEVTVRLGDAVHLTDDGARLLARQMAATVGPQLAAARARAT